MPFSSFPQPCVIRMRALLVLIAILIGTSGCAVGPNYRHPSTPVPDAWHQQLQDGTFVDVQGIREWWTIFDDATLNSLMQSVAEQNLDLFAALQRICQARERVNVSRSARLFQLDKTGTFSHSQTENLIRGFNLDDPEQPGKPISMIFRIPFWTTD